MNPKSICSAGLFFFVLSYIMFSLGSKLAYFQEPIDFAHWFNLIGAVLLFSFNRVFPKNNLTAVASFITTLGIIAHIGLCTIDFIMWSFGDDEAARTALSEHISTTPSILYPFIIIGPSLLFIGLAMHALNFIKTHTISSLMVILGAPTVGFSFFILKNGTCMVISCLLFALGLLLLLYRKENGTAVTESIYHNFILMHNQTIANYFSSDARDFILRYNLLKESATHIGLRSKLFVDLLFSLECSLKALLFFESDEDENQTFKKVKGLGHSIEKLAQKLNPESKEKFDELITIDRAIFNVFQRYLIESQIIFRNEYGALDSTYYDSIANPQWMEKFANSISLFIDYIDAAYPFEFKTRNLSDIDATAECEKHEKLKNITGKK